MLGVILDDCKRREVQPGLFDARELRNLVAVEAEGERLRSLSDRELQRLRTSAGVELGGFEPELVLEWPRVPHRRIGRQA